MKLSRYVLIVGSLWFACGPGVLAEAAESPLAVAKAESELTFEKDIRPILRAHCLDCHGAIEEKDGNLDLRLARFMIAGGDSGPAITAGKPDESYLLDRVKSGEMPPGDAKVPAEEIAILERWIAAGAPTARPEPETIGPGVPLLPEERNWWAFQPIQRPTVPVVPEASRARTPIDAFLVEAMPEGLSFSEDADKRALLIRVTMDLTGLPPTPADVERFLKDDRPDAYERLVDDLLNSPHYGERWGRHWLDVAGYADSEGVTAADAERSWAYQYRDYVVRSMNADKPFDQFLHEQLAGDELAGPIKGDLTPEQIELLTATGFLRMAADGTGSGGNTEESRNQVVADTMKIVSSSLMGMTVACAQCHDHRYDPISHIDYHALRAVFEPALDWKAWKTPAQRNVSLYTEADRAKSAEIEKEVAVVAEEKAKKQAAYIEEELVKELAKYEEPLRSELRAAHAVPPRMRNEEQKALFVKYPRVNITPGVLYQYNKAAADDLKKFDERIAEIRAKKTPERFVRALVEPAGHAPETKLFHRGDYRQPKQTIEPAAPAVLVAEDQYKPFPADDPNVPTTGRRLAFAQWLTSDANPTTARVLVNRVWLHHFGQGLVSTPGDFGKLGAKPTHPLLLDWLASEFMAEGWSLKKLHRLMVTSTAYRQSSYQDPAKVAIDGTNQYYWRTLVTRLDAEILRDRWLAVSGKLNTELFGPAMKVVEDQTGQAVVEGETQRRSLYIQQRRSLPVSVMQAFDAPVMTTNCEIRPSSTVATQSLMLMNGQFVLDQALAMARRVRSEAPQLAVAAEVREGLPPLAKPLPPAWQHGYGKIDEATGKTASFTAYPHFEKGVWQGGAARPDPVIGWSSLTADGGHTGSNPDFATIRRWVAPTTGEIRIAGKLNHPSPNGDGVRGRIVSSRAGVVGDWVAQHGEVATTVETIAVEAGDTIDFITDCRADVNSDSFRWNADITLTWDADRSVQFATKSGFEGPRTSDTPLQIDNLIRAWELAYLRAPSREELELAVNFINEQMLTMQIEPRVLPEGVTASEQTLANFCQILLTSNEMLYVE